MKISSKSDYAFKTLLYLARNAQKGVISIGEVAQEEKIPIKFLEQILLALKAGGLVGSKRGAKGGYFLVKDPAGISLEEVLKLMEDTILAPVRNASGELPGEDPFLPVWADINSYVFGRLAQTSLKEIVERADEAASKRALNFAI